MYLLLLIKTDIFDDFYHLIVIIVNNVA